jgi:acyl carrier protein
MSAEPAPSRTRIQDEIVAYLRRVAASRGRPAREIAPDVSFFDLGILDSLSLLDFVTFLEGLHAIEIPGHDIVPENFGSLAAVIGYLRRRREAAMRP